MLSLVKTLPRSHNLIVIGSRCLFLDNRLAACKWLAEGVNLASDNGSMKVVHALTVAPISINVNAEYILTGPCFLNILLTRYRGIRWQPMGYLVRRCNQRKLILFSNVFILLTQIFGMNGSLAGRNEWGISMGARQNAKINQDIL